MKIGFFHFLRLWPDHLARLSAGRMGNASRQQTVQLEATFRFPGILAIQRLIADSTLRMFDAVFLSLSRVSLRLGKMASVFM